MFLQRKTYEHVLIFFMIRKVYKIKYFRWVSNAQGNYFRDWNAWFSYCYLLWILLIYLESWIRKNMKLPIIWSEPKKAKVIL